MGTKYKETKIGRIPDDWDAVQIGKLGKVVTGSTPSTKDEEYWGEDIPFITPTDIGDSKTLAYVERYISHKGATVSRPIPPYSVCVTCIASIGKTCITKTASVTNQQINSIMPNEKFSSEYLYYMIVHNCERLKSFAGFTTVPIVKKSSFEKFLVALPPLPEQRKIAEVLSTVDDAIEKTDAIIQQTQQLKKGLMRKLFTEGIGHTRFKKLDFGEKFRAFNFGNIPDDWDFIQLRSVTIEHKQGLYTNENYTDEGVLLVRITDLLNPRLSYETMPKLSISNDEYEQFKVCEGDFLFARSGAIGRYGICQSTIRAVFGSYLIRFKFNQALLDNDYFGYLYQSETIRKQLEIITQGSSNQNINAENIKNLYIPLPSLDEQMRIAEVLSETDAIIEKEQDYKAELEQLKKGLMQVLLTGKVRVKV